MTAKLVRAPPTEDMVDPAQSRRNAADARNGVTSASSRFLPGKVDALLTALAGRNAAASE